MFKAFRLTLCFVHYVGFTIRKLKNKSSFERFEQTYDKVDFTGLNAVNGGK